jgi:hypothetical protein
MEDLAAQMQPGTWAELDTNNFFVGEKNIFEPDGPGNILEYANNAAWDPVSRQLVMLGSAHHGDFYPKFVKYSEDTNTWTSPSYPGFVVVHAYDHQALDPTTGIYYHRAPGASTIYQYNTRTSTWSGTLTIPLPSGTFIPCCAALEYFPEMGRLIFINGEGNGELYLFNPTTGQWTVRAPLNVFMGTYHNIAEYLPVHKVLIFGGGNDSPSYPGDQSRMLYKMDSAGNITRITDAPVGIGINQSVVTADPVSGNFLVFSSNGSIHEYNPATNMWSLLSGPPHTLVNRYGDLESVAIPIPNHGVVMVLKADGDQSKVYLYKRPSGVTSSATVGGYPMPSLEDERKTYRAWGWTWTADKEPNFPSDSTYSVTDPDIHGDTEGDNLWSYLMMYLRTGQKGYLDRAQAWARYFKQDYRSCIGDPYRSFCYDRDGFGLDHLYGWGLVAWYEYTGDTAALAEAENLAVEVESYWSKRWNNAFPVPGEFSMGYYGLRQGARHLLLVTRVAEMTQKQRWITLRDKLIDLWLQSPDWDPRGMYFVGDWQTDQIMGSGAYAAGARIQSAFELATLTEAFAHAYRTTGGEGLKNRIVAMARFVDQYGLDPIYQYTASRFGIVNGAVWHSYSTTNPVTFWEPVYTTSLVNTLAYGYKYTGDPHLYDRAKYFFTRGTKGIYGEPVQRAAGDAEVHHFVDTIFDSSSGNFYLAYNKGELQYTYLIFESPSSPGGTNQPPIPGDTVPPAAPTQLRVDVK